MRTAMRRARGLWRSAIAGSVAASSHSGNCAAGAAGSADGFAASTALLHGFGVVAALAMRRLPALGAAEAPWVRVAGAGICAAGMVLMLV